jgi:GntR family transcriptional regulator/MocR family aminotransferase
LTQQGDLFGLASLRSAIGNHLAAARGIVAEPGQIVIVNGTAEAMPLPRACWSRLVRWSA